MYFLLHFFLNILYLNLKNHLINKLFFHLQQPVLLYEVNHLHFHIQIDNLALYNLKQFFLLYSFFQPMVLRVRLLCYIFLIFLLLLYKHLFHKKIYQIFLFHLINISHYSYSKSTFFHILLLLLFSKLFCIYFFVL